jgi:hypothetical protein
LELGSPFDKWRVVIAPDYRYDLGYPAACYWLSDQTGKHHAFSFDLRDHLNDATFDWVKDDLRKKLSELNGSTLAG